MVRFCDMRITTGLDAEIIAFEQTIDQEATVHGESSWRQLLSTEGQPTTNGCLIEEYRSRSPVNGCTSLSPTIQPRSSSTCRLIASMDAPWSSTW